jgi:hypothetical protein
MGSHNHPCCEKNVNQSSPVATVQQPNVLHPVFTVVVSSDLACVVPAVESEFRHLTVAHPFHSPPSLNSPVRI